MIHMVSKPCILEPLLRLQIFHLLCASKYQVHGVLHPGPKKVKKYLVEILLFPESSADCYDAMFTMQYNYQWKEGRANFDSLGHKDCFETNVPL